MGKSKKKSKSKSSPLFGFLVGVIVFLVLLAAGIVFYKNQNPDANLTFFPKDSSPAHEREGFGKTNEPSAAPEQGLTSAPGPSASGPPSGGGFTSGPPSPPSTRPPEIDPPFPYPPRLETPKNLPDHEALTLDIGNGNQKEILFRTGDGKSDMHLNPERPFEKLLRPPWEKPNLQTYKGDVQVMQKPNIVLFQHKFLRAADVAPFSKEGHPAQTPTWKKLAENGISFMRTYSPFPNMASSLDAMMFGREPDSTSSYNFKSTSDKAPEFLGNVLAHDGYEVFVVGMVLWKKQKVKFAKSIRNFDAPREPESTFRSKWGDSNQVDTLLCRGGPGSRKPRNGKEVWDNHSNYKAMVRRVNANGEYDCFEELKLSEVVDWISKRSKNKPWAVLFGIEATRGPYRSPYHFHQNLKTGFDSDQHFDFYSDAKEIPKPPKINDVTTDVPYNFSFFNCPLESDPITEDLAVAYRASYYAALQYADWIMGQVVDKVKEKGFTDNTMFIATANQGSMMGEQGQVCGYSLQENVTRVPLVIQYPGLPVERRGQKCWQMVELIDIFPTILDMCSIKPKSALRLDGVSLLPLFRNLMSEVRTVSRSQYVRCGSDKEMLENDEKLKRTNFCTASGIGNYKHIHLAGYSVRSKDFRLNLWMANPK